MGMTWTEEQERIITHREGNLLVSAAAGSGKTAVLVAHVISRVTDRKNPVSLSELLIMTFTEAAAAEMRSRIQAALEERLRQEPENVLLIRELGRIQNADISTIDAFCKRLITENYALLKGLDPGFRIGDEGELKLLKSDIIEELLEEHYLKGEECFLRFMDQFTRGKSDEGVEELILRLYDYASATPWQEEYLRDLESGGEEEAEALLLASLLPLLEDDALELERALMLCAEEGGPEEYLPMLTEDLEELRRVLSAETLDSLRRGLSELPFSRLKLSRAKKREAVKELREAVKKHVQELLKRLILPEPEKRAEVAAGIRESIGVLRSLTEEFLHRFREEKDRRKMLDFSDLEHFALELLYIRTEEGRRVPSPLADDYARNLKEILVDEYQDSNEVQEWLLSALSAERFGRPDVFQVGDVKQSIYSFRQARPELFLSKYREESYPKIELAKNFRSRAGVLDAVNQVFSRVMREAVGGIDYNERVSLHLGRGEEPASPDGEDMEASAKKVSDDQTELLLCDYGTLSLPDGEEVELGRAEAEARMIAHRIRGLREEGYSYRDIVILLRSLGDSADRMVEVLGNEGIPAYSVSREGYFSAVEVETVLAFLSIIDNPRQSIPLAAVMHSPIFGFTDAELAEISAAYGTLERRFPGEDALRNGNTPEQADGTEQGGEEPAVEEGEALLSPALSEKLSHFRRTLRHFRALSRYRSIHELLYCIYEETGYYEYASAMPAGRKRRANLDQLVDSALRFEQTSYRGLFDFIRYIEKLKKYNADQGEASVYSEQDDLVRIISMHKSKGLQFPVVFLAGMGRSFHTRDLNGKLLIDAELGVAADYIDPAEKLRYPSVRRLVIRDRLLRQQLGEELRILYVGMTRAEEKLILAAGLPDAEKRLSRLRDRTEPLTASRILSASSMLDWILMAEGDRLLSDTGSAPIRLCCFPAGELFDRVREKLTAELDLEEAFLRKLHERERRSEDGDPEYEKMAERLSFHYAHEAATRLFPKHTVSEIKKESGAFLPRGQILPGRAIRLEVEEESLGERMPLPEAYQKEASGAEIGDAYHHALAAYDFERGMEQLGELLPAAELALIQEDKLREFLLSPLGQRMREAAGSGRLFREQSFMKEVPYSYLFPGSGITEKVLLQGVIDAFILEEDGILLLDYKTDRVRTERTLRERYAIQLRLYADALTALTGREVKSRLIYSFALGRTVMFPPEAKPSD